MNCANQLKLPASASQAKDNDEDSDDEILLASLVNCTHRKKKLDVIISVTPEKNTVPPKCDKSSASLTPGSCVYLVTPLETDDRTSWVPNSISLGGELLVGRIVRCPSVGVSLIRSFDASRNMHLLESLPRKPTTTSLVSGSSHSLGTWMSGVDDLPWESLDHGGSLCCRRNDAYLGLEAGGLVRRLEANRWHAVAAQTLPEMMLPPEFVGDYNDSDSTAWENGDWLARRRAWRALKRTPPLFARSSLPRDAISCQRRGLPPVGMVLNVQKKSGSGSSSLNVRCARMFYPEDTARGRERFHGADEMFLGVTQTSGRAGARTKCQLITVDLEVSDEANLLRADVTRRSTSVQQQTRSLSDIETLHGFVTCPRCWAAAYSLDTDSYFDDVEVQVPKTSSRQLKDSFATGIVRSSSPHSCSSCSHGGDGGFCEGEGEGDKPRLKLTSHALAYGLGRRVLLSPAPQEWPPPTQLSATRDSSRLGRVLAFDSSSGEHFVQFDALSGEDTWTRIQKGEWRPLQEETGPSFSWICSLGCWIAVLDVATSCREDTREASGPSLVLPLEGMLAHLRASKMEPFDIPKSILKDIDEGIPIGVPHLQEHSYSRQRQQQDSLKNRNASAIHVPPEVEEIRRQPATCARCRPWSKEENKRSSHVRPTSILSLDADCSINSSASNEFQAPGASGSCGIVGTRARESRRDARHVRGVGAACSLWEDGRLEQGGFATGSNRLRFGRSRIEGWGVFTDDFISKGEPVLEYRGVLIGNAVADKKEREYRKEKRDDYQFRMDTETVVDATKRGSLARYVNHSCEPNCFTQIAEYGAFGTKKKKIIIYSKRDIEQGEELKYDYKFAMAEEGEERLPCFCGAEKCRGFLN